MAELREELIEAIAPLTRHPHLLLDRLLDVLADRADEWDDLAFERSVGERPGMVGPSDYLAVFRGDTEPKENE